MLRKICKAACVATIALASFATAAHADLRRSGAAQWTQLGDGLGLTISGYPSVLMGEGDYCGGYRAAIQQLRSHFGRRDFVMYSNVSQLIDRINGFEGGERIGNGDDDGWVYAKVFDCGVKLPGRRLTGPTCVSLDVNKPEGPFYCAPGAQM